MKPNYKYTTDGNSIFPKDPLKKDIEIVKPLTKQDKIDLAVKNFQYKIVKLLMWPFKYPLTMLRDWQIRNFLKKNPIK